MEEIAKQFKEELQELLDRYKTKLSVPRIMHVAQDTFHKTLSIRYHPELHSKVINYFLQSTGINKPDLQGEFKYIDPEEHLNEIVNSGPSSLERYSIKNKENPNA